MTDEQLIADINNRMSVTQIAEGRGVKKNAIYKRIKELGIKAYTEQGALSEDYELIKELRLSGMPLAELADKFDVSYHSMATWLSDNKITLRNSIQGLDKLPKLSVCDLTYSLDTLTEACVIYRNNGKHHVILPAEAYMELINEK